MTLISNISVHFLYFSSQKTSDSPVEPPPSVTPAPVASTTTPDSPPAVSSSQTGRVFASPLARKLAKEKGVDLPVS